MIEHLTHVLGTTMFVSTSICCSMGCSGVWHMYTSEGVYVIPRAKPEELHNTRGCMHTQPSATVRNAAENQACIVYFHSVSRNLGNGPYQNVELR